MLRDYKDRLWRVQFDSLAEMVSWADNTPAKWNTRGSRQRAAEDWDLNAGWDGAVALARTGWEAGVRNLSAMAATVPNAYTTTRGYDMAGDYADVGRYLAGDPMNMVRRRRQRAPRPTMTIVVNTVCSANVSGKEFANFGAAMVALVDRLESRGVRVELIGCMTSELGRGRAAMSWTVKEAEDSLDLGALAFSLAHPAMLRRIGFAVWERSPAAWETSSYGVPGKPEGSDLISLPDGALVIGGIGSSFGSCSSMAGALAFATSQINEAYKAAGFGDAVAELEEVA